MIKIQARKNLLLLLFLVFLFFFTERSILFLYSKIFRQCISTTLFSPTQLFLALPPPYSTNFGFVSPPPPKKNNKNNTEKHGTHFVLANNSWAQGLPWCVVEVPNGTLLIFHIPAEIIENHLLLRAGLPSYQWLLKTCMKAIILPHTGNCIIITVLY